MLVTHGLLFIPVLYSRIFANLGIAVLYKVRETQYMTPRLMSWLPPHKAYFGIIKEPRYIPDLFTILCKASWPVKKGSKQ